MCAHCTTYFGFLIGKLMMVASAARAPASAAIFIFFPFSYLQFILLYPEKSIFGRCSPVLAAGQIRMLLAKMFAPARLLASPPYTFDLHDVLGSSSSSFMRNSKSFNPHCCVWPNCRRRCASMCLCISLNKLTILCVHRLLFASHNIGIKYK